MSLKVDDCIDDILFYILYVYKIYFRSTKGIIILVYLNLVIKCVNETKNYLYFGPASSGNGGQASERECESPPEPAPPEVPPRGPSLHVTLRHRPCEQPAEPDRLYLSEGKCRILSYK